MRYGVDAIYAIGAGHKVCQDYCAAQLIAQCNKARPVLIVADGCSSSRDSDIGARLVARAALNHAGLALERAGDPLWWRSCGTAIAGTLKRWTRSLRLPAEALDATLVYGLGDGNTFRVGFYGDGYAVIKTRGGAMRVIQVTYESNAPRYLSYWMDQARGARYGLEFPGRVIIRTYDGTESGFVLTGELYQDVHQPVAMAWPEEELSLVIISTDGLGSFTRNGIEQVPWQQVLPEVVAFKSPAGEFLQRRITRMKAVQEKSAIRHWDDLGLAACRLQPEGEEETHEL